MEKSMDIFQNTKEGIHIIWQFIVTIPSKEYKTNDKYEILSFIPIQMGLKSVEINQKYKEERQILTDVTQKKIKGTDESNS